MTKNNSNKIKKSPVKNGNIKKAQETYLTDSIYRHFYKFLDRTWDKLPNYLGTTIATVAIFIAGSMFRGDWLLILVHFIRQTNPQDSNSTSELGDFDWTLERYKLKGLGYFLLIDLAVSYLFYFLLCGFLQWYFYIRRRDRPEEWKCQPYKFLTPEQERHEIILGSINIAVGAVAFGTVACFVQNGGRTALYLKPDEYGWIWLILSIPTAYIFLDLGAYVAHRILHTPFMYKNLHKWHHYYKQPTAFSVTAMHPLELLFFQSFMLLPVFTVPMHALVYVGNLLYIYYYGIMGHSGVDLDSFWPWQPDTMFHDNHHQYFHVNFGFNMWMWDKLFGTYRVKNRIYNENIYGGKGISMADATEDLKKEHKTEWANEKKRTRKLD